LGVKVTVAVTELVPVFELEGWVTLGVGVGHGDDEGVVN
jgi:hypothetical protein